MFIAIKSDGSTFSLLQNYSKLYLQKLRAQESFVCPSCSGKLVLKLGTKKIHHFAHVKSRQCTASSEGESQYHLQGKKTLYEWLNGQQVFVEVEPYFKEIKQRPDLFLQFNNKKYVIEFQCTSIPEFEVRKRSTGYLKLGITPLWILGGNHIKRQSNGVYKFTRFQWQFLKEQESKMYIIYLCPQTKKLIILSNIHNFSATQATASYQIHPLKETPVTSLLYPSIVPDNTLQTWRKKRLSWIMNHHLKTFNKQDPYIQLLYLNKIPFSQIPPQVGWPVRYMELIETSPIIWQMYIYLDIFKDRKIGDKILFQEVYLCIKKRVNRGEIKVRSLLFIKDAHYAFAVMNFLQFLVKLHYVKKIDQKQYQILKLIQIESHIEHVVSNERTFFTRISKSKLYTNDYYIKA